MGPIAFLFSPENRPWTLAIIIAATALAAFLILDGGDTSTVAAGSDTTQAAGTDGTSTSAETSGSAAETPTDLPSALTSDECLSAASALSLASTGGLAPSGQLDSTGIDDAFQQMSAVAPSAISDDLATMADAFRQFFSILQEENIDLNDPNSLTAAGAPAAFERAGAALEASGFSEAADNVNAWLETTCADFISP